MKKLLIVTLTLALIFALATCNDDKGDDTSPCTCLSTYGTTAHLGIDEPCNCGGTGCECTEQTDSSYNIPIRKTAGVTVQQMNDTVALIKTAMGHEMFANKELFSAKGLTAIHIISGSVVDFQNGIMTVGYEAEYNTIGLKLFDIYNIVLQRKKCLNCVILTHFGQI